MRPVHLSTIGFGWVRAAVKRAVDVKMGVDEGSAATFAPKPNMATDLTGPPGTQTLSSGK